MVSILTRVQRLWLFAAGAGVRARAHARDHSRTLVGLFSTSFFLNLGNSGGTLLLVIATPAAFFGSYLVAQSVVLLSATLADGGLATAARIIAAGEHPDAVLIATLQKVLNRYAVMLAALALSVIAVLAEAFSRFDRPGGVHVPFGMLLLSAGMGVIQARCGVCAALIYSGGQFRSYSTAVLIPSALRLASLSALVVTHIPITLPLMLANDLTCSLIGWIYCSVWLRRLGLKAATQPLPAGNAPILNRQVHQLLRSGMVPSFLEAIALQSVILAGGAFGTGIAVAIFGVFVRAIQIIKVVLDPLITYGERRLRLAAPAHRLRAEASFLGFVMAIYTLVAFAIMLVYSGASASFHHYALGHSFEMAFCLTATLVSFSYLCLDSILLSRGYSNFRLPGTILQVLTASLLVTILHPASLWQLLVMSGLIAVPRFAFYSWFYLTRLSDSRVWTLWVPETIETVSVGEQQQ